LLFHPFILSRLPNHNRRWLCRRHGQPLSTKNPSEAFFSYLGVPAADLTIIRKKKIKKLDKGSDLKY
jgi:hypothetical protein